ncbi:MAG: hypothetical protein Q4C50_05055 [Eubacteriales bacterium]|nr:hypothetical protein [Eubacteriales bacterium]
MREFIDGTDEQFANLKKSLQDEKCHVYHKCKLPSCCSRQMCSIAFEKDMDAYTLLIDNGIVCSKTLGGTALVLFRQWLAAGRIIFLDFNDLKEFLKSLWILY